MKFELKPDHRNVPNEELLADRKKVFLKLGKEKITRDEYNENGKYTSTTFERRFGSWNKFLEKSGLQLQAMTYILTM